jgi:hypothetical protein
MSASDGSGSDGGGEDFPRAALLARSPIGARGYICKSHQRLI